MAKKGDKEDKRIDRDLRVAEIGASVEKQKNLLATINRLIVGAAAVACTYFVAGSETSLSAVFKGEVNQGFVILVLTLVSGVTTVGWRRERTLRAREVERLSATVKTYERVLDPRRSTTGLGPFGEPEQPKMIEVTPLKRLGDGKTGGEK